MKDMSAIYLYCHDVIKDKDFLEVFVYFKEKKLRDLFLNICEKNYLLSMGISKGEEYSVSVRIPDKEFMKTLVKEFNEINKGD